MKELLANIWTWVEHNRGLIVAPVIALVLWSLAVSCTPTTGNPLNPGEQLTAAQLDQTFSEWQKQQEIILSRFDFSRADLEQQRQEWNQVQEALMTLVSGGAADTPSLLKLLTTGGLIGLLVDNVRKGVRIKTLKKN